MRNKISQTIPCAKGEFILKFNRERERSFLLLENKETCCKKI